MPDSAGHIELERRVDSIIIGVRHRKDLGDIDALARSIDELGLLQPVTITPAGVLVCGRRRLEAVRRLEWRTLKVWVRSGISDELSGLLAQQDENALHKPLSPVEAETLYREVKRVLAEEAEQRQAATRFGGDGRGGDAGEVNGAGGRAAPRGVGDSRAQASRLVTGAGSYKRLEQVGWLKRVAGEVGQPAPVRELAARALADIGDGGFVEPAYRRVKAATDLASPPVPETNDADPEPDLARLAADALARVEQEEARRGLRALRKRPVRLAGPAAYRSVRSFILTWTELNGWSRLYDVDELAAGLDDDEWRRFEGVVAESVAFADRVRAARRTLASA